MKRFCFSIATWGATCLALLCATSVLGQDISPQALRRAKAELHKAVASGQIAGGAHLVMHHGKVVLFEVAGVRDVEDRAPMQADTIMRIYSMTKPITSVAAMTLFEQGKFQLDDSVSQYIPAFGRTTVLVEDDGETRIVPGKRQITIRDVFRHTTGYSYGDSSPTVREYYEKEKMLYGPPQGMFPPKMTIQQASEALARIPALHHPGERFTYGFNTDLLGRLIEVWSAMPLDEYMQRAVFDPLAMSDTGFSVPADRRHRLASCHTMRDGKVVIADKAAESPFSEGFQFVSGGGGLVSTMKDYANFCQMLVDGGEFAGRRLLKEETVKLMFTDQLHGVAGDFRFGLGFAIETVRLGADKRDAMEYRWGGYASTDFRLVPKERLLQIFMLQLVPSSHRFADQQIQIVYEGLP